MPAYINLPLSGVWIEVLTTQVFDLWVLTTKFVN